jgi:hypothetical protein
MMQVSRSTQIDRAASCHPSFALPYPKYSRTLASSARGLYGFVT